MARYRGFVRWGALGGALLTALFALALPVASADHTDVVDCTADVGDPVPGSLAWDLADQNNRWCANEGPRTAAANPAWYAAVAANGGDVNPDDPLATVTDPFRAVVRWADVRGDHQEVTWTDSSGVDRPGAMFGPLDGGSGVGAVVVRHPTGGEAPYLWASQMLAEHGYVVFSPEVDGDVATTVEATDWFLSEENPWSGRLDSERLGIAGHSAAGSVAVNVGNIDPRYDAVVAWDSGAIPGDEDLRTPTMYQLGEYGMLTSGVTFFEPRRTRPVPEGKWTRFEEFRAAGVDTMQVSLRASTHFEWSNAISAVRPNGASLYGESVAAYYTLSWFDHHLRGSQEALRRLTATSTFDEFSDRYAIGTGHFDAAKARAAEDIEAGNVPITIGGLSVRDRLSWWYPTRYFLDGGALQCEDVRGGCPGPDEWQPGDSRAPRVGGPGSSGPGM